MRELVPGAPAHQARALAAIALTPLLVLGLAACGGSAAPGASSGAGRGGQPDTIVVTAREFAFDPSEITVAAGDVTFSVTNDGSQEHEFEIFRGDIVVDEVEGLVPGLTREFTVTLAPGDYTYVCKLTGHEEAGMTGSLTVTDQAAVAR
jgi:iron uptake system component EfeO